MHRFYLHCVRCCRLSVTSRENQVQPEVFEMFNTIGSSIPLSAAEFPPTVCLCASAQAWGPDSLSWEPLVESFSLQTPLGEPC